MNRRRAAWLSLALAATLAALACSGGDDTPLPADPTPAETAASVTDPTGTPTAAPASSPAPAPTEGAATPEATPDRTPDPFPTATPEASATPTATPTAADRAAAARAAYRAALEARDEGDLDAAIEGFERARDAGGPLAPVATLRLAQALAAADRSAEAANGFAGALDDPLLPASLHHSARLERGDVLAALDRTDEALAQYAAAAAALASPFEIAEARWRAATTRQTQDDPRWIDDALAVVASAPGATAAVAALDALDEAAVAAPALQAAYVRYLSHDDAAATALYESAAAAPSAAAEGAIAWFYLGALVERALDNPSAIEAYERSLELDPGGYLADDSHWWLALRYEDSERPQDALSQYDELSTSFPASRFTRGAALGSALSLYRAGEEAAAAARLRGLMAEGSATEAATAARWLAVLGLRTDGDPLPADYDPGALAAVVEASTGETLGVGPVDELRPPAADWEAALAWMDARFGPRPASGGSALEGDTYTLVGELLAVGERDLARSLLFALVSEQATRPHELLELAQAAADAGVHDVALVGAIRLLAPLDPDERAAAPLAIELLAYPAPFSDELLAAAEAEGVPPLLLLALVRQESAFNPDAGSPAGALGLTPVIPPTGAQIAASLEVRWDPALLYEPESSLLFGAHYLAAQLEHFDGDLLAALAAYNAGQTQAERWFGLQWAPGPDGYLDAVDFSETRLYLERVIENYAGTAGSTWDSTHPASSDAPVAAGALAASRPRR